MLHREPVTPDCVPRGKESRNGLLEGQAYPTRRARGGPGLEKPSGSRVKDFPSPPDHTSASGQEELKAMARLRQDH